MALKKLTQAGINRVIWHLLKRVGGKINIPERAIDGVNTDDAIRIDYDPSLKTFTFSLHKIKKPEDAIIVQPGLN